MIDVGTIEKRLRLDPDDRQHEAALDYLGGAGRRRGGGWWPWAAGIGLLAAADAALLAWAWRLVP